MTLDWEAKKHVINKAIQEMIDHKQIKINDLYVKDIIGMQVASALETAERDLTEHVERQTLFNLAEKYFPGTMIKFFEARKKGNDGQTKKE